MDSGGRQADAHPGVFDADLTALPEGGRPRTQDGGSERTITADAIEATEFMDLSRKYRVTGVPKTIVNETIEIMGGLPEKISSGRRWSCRKNQP